MRRLTVFILLAGLAATGCARYFVNVPLTQWHKDTGYRFDALDLDEGNTDSLFVCLSLSGGGTRAAAFAYGVMKELRKTKIVWKGRPTTLLAEIDCISSVSGGSFTAAYYGLFRDELFEHFERDFLKRNITHALIGRVLNPLNWPRLASPNFNRIDLAAELYDETVFRRATFQSLIQSRRRPFVVLNATNMRNGVRFEFTQNQFDFLGSSLDSYPVARAVAASSAFPFLLSPLTVKAYGRAPGFEVNEEYTTSMQDFDLSPARYHWARPQLEYLDQKRVKYVHLLDGGLSDNIGLRAVQRASEASDGFIFGRGGRTPIERLVVIAVNAKTDPDDASSLSSRAPGVIGVALKTATVSMENYSFETIQTARERAQNQESIMGAYAECGRMLGECQPPRALEPLAGFKTCVIEVSFDAIKDAQRQRKFLNLATSFDLPSDTVDEVVEMGATLIRESPYFVSLVRALGGQVEGAPESLSAQCD